VTRGEVDLLKERSALFYQAALDDQRVGRTDFILFHCEQALQLAVKYLIAKKYGYFPRTHDLFSLLEMLKDSDPHLYSEFKENAELIDLMEDAYVGARYLPRHYSPESARKVLAATKALLTAMGVIEANDQR